MIWTWALVRITKILQSNNWFKLESSSSTIKCQLRAKSAVFLHFRKTSIAPYTHIGVSNPWVGNATKQKQHLQSLSQSQKQPDTQTASPELRPLNGEGFTFHWSGHSPIRRQTPALPGTSKSAFFQCAHDWMCFCPSSGSYIVQCELSRQGCKEIWRGSIPRLAWVPVCNFFFFTNKLISLLGQDAVLAGSSISTARILSGNTEVVL